MNYTRDQKAQAFDKLPQAVKESLTSEELEQKLRNLTRKYHLRIDQGKDFYEVIVVTILGLEKSEKFQENIKKHARVDNLVASGLTKDANELIFKEIKNNLMKSTEETGGISKPDEKELDHKEALRGIEDEPEEYSREETLQIKKPEVVDNKEPKTTTPPPNLPFGNVEDVPKHGHDHKVEVSDQTPKIKLESSPIEKNLAGVVSEPKEDVDFSVRNIDKAMEKTDNKPTVDPYRESVN